MTELIKSQLLQILIMFYCGLAMMVVFNLRDRLMDRCKKYRRLRYFIYFTSWIFASFLFYHFLYRGSYGVVTVYGIAAMAAGMLLWKKAIYGIIFSSSKQHFREEENNE